MAKLAPKSTPKSKYKNAFIRVSAENNTEKDGLVKYTFEEFCNIVMTWANTKQMKYYLIEHNGEPNDPNTHFHGVLDFGRNGVPFDQLKRMFPYGKIEHCRNVTDCVQYLVHLNDLSKQAYSWDKVVTNADLGKFMTVSNSTAEQWASYYVDKIMAGEIREFNFAEMVDPQIYARKKSVLNNALELYRRKVFTDKDRQVKVIVCEGASGTGKTTWAKNYCKQKGLSVCLSSGSNDPWQDYMGEDVLLLDELRSDVFSLSDLLKILDNHTKSSARSRYSNKLFLGHTIIITTNEDWNSWYLKAEVKERNALKRRAETYMKFTKTKAFEAEVKIYRWDVDVNKYKLKQTTSWKFKQYLDIQSQDEDDVDFLFD